jgi:N-acetylneuraminate synthase
VSVYIIAEAGVNHNGNKELAFKLIDAAAESAANAVKFQTFKAEELVLEKAPKALYQRENTDINESHYDMLKSLELSWDTHIDLMDHCARRNITFLSTPFDNSSLTFLARTLKLKILKISSGDLTNGPLLLSAGKSDCDIILSTGISTLDEIEEALSVLAFGLVGKLDPLSRRAFKDAYASKKGQEELRKRVSLLHCTTDYPAPFEETNLLAMQTMREAFGLKIGLSDHTPGIAVPIAAAALGAEIIEKHFTIDRTLSGPDHKASIEPSELNHMVRSIRNIEKAIGNGIKSPQPSELRNRDVVRKSLVALGAVKNGELFTKENLGVKRPGGGISPMDYWDWLDKKAKSDFDEGEQL